MDQSAYTLTEAARYLKVPPATLRSWVVGRGCSTTAGARRFQPLIHPPVKLPPTLSFANLIEAHVVRALRTDHGVSVKKLRTALRFAEHALGIERLLLRQELSTGGGDVFLERYGNLINLTASGQIAMRRMLEEHLKRIEWNAACLPVRLYPFLSAELHTSDRPIAIDPRIAFGRPVVLRRGITTLTIAERLDAGESVGEVAADYDLSVAEINDAVLYERAA